MDKLYITPVQYFVKNNTWANYNEATWDKKPWILGCGGCHATGVDLREEHLCRAGRRLRSLPRQRVPGTPPCPRPQSLRSGKPSSTRPSLPSGVEVQICGSCHNRGKATQHKEAEWAGGLRAGQGPGEPTLNPSPLPVMRSSVYGQRIFQRRTISNTLTGYNPSMLHEEA